jgi:predicted RNase H-like HicB family nuclease
MTQYIALIHKDADSDFGVSFPDFPGCVTAGSTLDEAREMAAEALALHIEGMEEDGDEIPAPSSLDQVMSEPENRDGVVMVVNAPADEVSKSERINVMVPTKTLKRIDSYVKAKGYSRSGFLVAAAETAMSGAGLVKGKPSTLMPPMKTVTSAATETVERAKVKRRPKASPKSKA